MGAGKAADLTHWELAVCMIAFVSMRSTVVDKSAVVRKSTPSMNPQVSLHGP